MTNSGNRGKRPADGEAEGSRASRCRRRGYDSAFLPPLQFPCSSLNFDFSFLIHQDKGHQLQPIPSPSSSDGSSTGNSIIWLLRVFQLFKLLPFQSLGFGRTSRCTPSILSRGGAQVSPGEGRSPGGARRRLQEVRHRSSRMGGPAEAILRRHHRFDIFI